jgi:hypothetical protein
MGSTWKWAILAALIELGTMGSAQSVGFLADVDARACLSRSYSVIPLPGSASVDPNEPWPVDYGQMTLTAAPSSEEVVSYVAMLALSSAVMVALACLLLLVLAGIVTKVQERPVPCAVSSSSFPDRRHALAAMSCVPQLHER